MTNRIPGGKTVTLALWLVAFELLFIVSFHFSLWRQAEKKMTGERSRLSQLVPGSHLCVDLVLQHYYLASVARTSPRRDGLCVGFCVKYRV